jgi:hypothetical protein
MPLPLEHMPPAERTAWIVIETLTRTAVTWSGADP